MGWLSILSFGEKLFDYVTGGKSRERRALEAQLQELEDAYTEAVIAGQVDRANLFERKLRELRNRVGSGGGWT